MKLKYFKLILLFTGVIATTSCKKFLDINTDPDRLLATNNPIAQLLSSAQVNMGFEGGSDMFRYTTEIMQLMSGLASSPNQTFEYYRYNITGSDQNNVWSSMFATTLSDLELILQKGAASPYYTGIAKIMKAYEYSLVVDVWGDVPYTEAQQGTNNLQPRYDDDATIYPKLIQLCTDGIADLNAASSQLTPGTNSVIYTNGGNFTNARAQWIKLANTLKLRLYLHYSKRDPAFSNAQITALINQSGVTFLAANSDNFSMPFYDLPNQRNPISAFEVSRPGYLYADARILSLMGSKSDPRRPYYFTSFPYQGIPVPLNFTTNNSTAAGNVLSFLNTSGASVGLTIAGTNIPAGTTITAVTPTSITMSNNVTGAGVANGAAITIAPNAFVGVSATAPPPTPNANYSRIHVFLRGNVTAGAAPPFTYSGAAPQRMITFAEYNFIRAEAALRGAPGSAQAFFTAGITASMQEVGVSAAQIADYLAANGTLTGSTENQIRQIIEEKYVALFGVTIEPWTDYRRTGYPTLSIPTNAIATVTQVPRSLFYPQSEIDLNPNNPGQKSVSLQDKVFWDQ